MDDVVAATSVNPSHLIVHVSNTDDTIAFYRMLFDAEVTDDHTFGAPALDAIFQRAGVVIRSTFLLAGGYRLHTIETIDVPRDRPPVDAARTALGVTGLSFEVPDIDRIRARAEEAGLGPTEIYRFHTELMDHAARMFFVVDPDGLRLEILQIVR